MILNKVAKFSFLIMILGLFLSLYLIFGTKTMPYMGLSSSVNLFASSFVLLVLFFNKNEIKNKILNLICLNIFIFFTLVQALILLYASPDNSIYINESSIFLFSFTISSSALFLIIDKNLSKLKSFLLFFYFSGLILIPITLSLIYAFSSPDNNINGVNTSFVFLGISFFIFITMSQRTIYSKFLRIAYSLVSGIFILYLINFIYQLTTLNLMEYKNIFNNTFLLVYLSILLNLFSIYKCKNKLGENTIN